MLPTDKSAIKTELHALGLRVTGPRVAVLGLLRLAGRPLSHGEVADELGGTDWDRATIFRNLVKLCEVGLVRVSSHAGGLTRYEAIREHGHEHLHAHFSCNCCGRVECLAGAELPLLADLGWREAVRDAEVQVLGTCPTCRQQGLVAHPPPKGLIPT
jgi:Fur family transcriptional regulator, ferric uptake regulator